jgi:2,3-bisphosphoglycerate-dependent phosphoglycerate mutase
LEHEVLTGDIPKMSLRFDPSVCLLGYLVRHGELNIGNKWDGWGNYDLSTEGVLSAEKAGQWLSFERIGRIISSDVPRTIHTADIIAEACAPACMMVMHDPNLRPLMVAGFTGEEKTPARLAEFQKYLDDPNLVIPGGESQNQLNLRVQVISQYLCTPYDALPTVIVCHNSVIKAFMGIPKIREAVAPGGIVGVYMNQMGELEFEVKLGQVAAEVGVS